MPNIVVNSEAEWHTIREQHVGGSEVASLFYRWNIDGEIAVRHMFEVVPEHAVPLGCLGPHKTGYGLFMEKLGEVKAKDIGAMERVQAGTFIEPALAAWANEKWGWKLRKVHRYMTHDTVKGWGATLDYEIHGEGMPPVEFKNVDGAIFRREWITESDEIVLPPLHINLQLQHQIGCAKSDHGWIVACAGGNELKRGKVDRHEPTQVKIGQAITAFWDAIGKRFIPERVADIDSVAEAYAIGDKAKIVDLTADEMLPSIIRRYQRWKEHLGNVETHVDNLKGRIAQRMGDASKATAEGFNLTWPAVSTAAKMVPARWQDEKNYRGALYISTPKPKGKA
ncbi:COG5377 Phage-related protein, predicted endonuclease [uncultured Caudovirales phage]|uniref:COG5377 Phage-related protein, predicted endonuclease n=1 Tax=uncultured Caudovirales phage TaxID=2100421 RepID=A0A6J5Q7R7_9CAUD|nr:COG5377 Phage-related protein, predicted endonuclease [uncultured Caudovirales phage]